MKFKKNSSLIFYILVIFVCFFFLNHNHSSYLFVLFAIIFILFRERLVRKHQILEKKLLFLISLFIYQTIYPININDSIDTIQFLILSRKNLWFVLLLSMILFIFFLIYQDKLYLGYINPDNLSFGAIKLFKKKKSYYATLYDDSRDTLNRKNIKYLVGEIPRHGYISYTSQYNLSDTFFAMSSQAIQEDNRLYIILSNTGSPASEVISLFTHKDFNHLSLSFDRELSTMVSYNGGNNFQEPGLNTEDLNSLHQKDTSHVLVYSLKATKEQKQKILDKIKRISEEGSAYNVLGLVTNQSVRPNMMFCSQFVYSMLQEVGLDFFEASRAQVKPTDFIEKDYFQKLEFEYEIDFSNPNYEKTN